MATTKSGWFWTAVAGGALVLGGIGYGVFKPASQSSERNASQVATPAPSINIITEGEVPLTFEMASATVDIQWNQRTMLERTLTEPEFVAKMKALGFQRMWNFGDLALMNYAYAFVPTVTPPTHGNGYNGKESDFPTPQGDSFKVYNNGVLAKSWAHDWLDYTLEFERTIGVKSDVCLNKKETWAQVDYKIKSSTGEYVKFASETTTTGWNYQQYLTWAKKMRDSITKHYGTTKKLIADEPNMLKGGKPAAEWRANVNPTNLTGFYGARVYWQWGDQMNPSLNQDTNIAKMDVFFTDSIPSQIASFKRLFPGWKIFATEIVIVDNREDMKDYQFINKSMTGVYCIGRYAQSFIENQEIQPLAVHMSLRGLIDEEENNTKAWSMVNKLFNADYTRTAATFTSMEGCTGANLHSSSSKKFYTILINNGSKNTYTIPKVNIDGKSKSPTYTEIRMYSTDGTWQGVVVKDTISTATITIPPCSVNVISFTLGNSTAESKVK